MGHTVLGKIVTDNFKTKNIRKAKPEELGQDEVSKSYSFPKSYISYRKPRVVSTEQRERARQMMIERNMMKEV
jgi:hypothetical protein